jgi:large subunit ribosomal protein L10
MTREEKSIAIEDLTAQLAGTNIVYVADISGLNADTTSIEKSLLQSRY